MGAYGARLALDAPLHRNYRRHRALIAHTAATARLLVVVVRIMLERERERERERACGIIMLLGIVSANALSQMIICTPSSSAILDLRQSKMDEEEGVYVPTEAELSPCHVVCVERRGAVASCRAPRTQSTAPLSIAPISWPAPSNATAPHPCTLKSRWRPTIRSGPRARASAQRALSVAVWPAVFKTTLSNLLETMLHNAFIDTIATCIDMIDTCTQHSVKYSHQYMQTKKRGLCVHSWRWRPRGEASAQLYM
jgi:hypothetical protein